MKLFNKIFECIFAPFNVLIRSNAKPDPNKYIRPLLIFLISICITAALILLVYREVIFK